MAELKTKPTDRSVDEFIHEIADERKRRDAATLVKLMEKISKAKARMWGDSIVGFGDYRYKYASGREGDWFVVGFSPRKQNLTIYFTPCFADCDQLLEKLGKHKRGVGCLYIKTLDDVDMKALEQLLRQSVKSLKKWKQK